MSTERSTPRPSHSTPLSGGDLAQVGRGFLMGGADVIPGVSGGTVALILGIYERLVTAISRVDLELLDLVKSRRWRAAAEHVDLRFLVFLGAGIATGVVGLASLMHYLLEHHLQHTFAAFFGLILASSILVARMVERWHAGAVASLAAGGLFAFWLVARLPASPPEGLGYVFLCGCIAICAMILPGISGAFILLLMGKYEDITGLVKDAAHGHVTGESLLTMGVFGLGCLVGLLSFCKALRWLLARHESITMAVLCGFMAGSLRKLWPYKEQVVPAGIEPESIEFKKRVYENVWPGAFGSSELISIGILVLAAAFVLVLDQATHGHEHVPPLRDDPADDEGAVNS